MSPRSTHLLVAVSLVLSCTAGPPPSQIVIAVASDLRVPEELDAFSLSVRYAGSTLLDNTYWLGSQRMGAIELPATLVLVQQGSSTAPVEIAISGRRQGSVVVAREAAVRFAKGRRLLLRLPLLRACAGRTCPSAQTCTETGCGAVEVGASDLPEHGQASLAPDPFPDAAPADSRSPDDAGTDVLRPDTTPRSDTAPPPDAAPPLDAPQPDLEPSPLQGWVVVTEFMANPAAVPDNAGEYVEVYNASKNPIDLKDWTLADMESDAHTIAQSVVVQPGDYVVLAANSNSQQNGGLQADYQYTDFFLGNSSDEIVLLDPDGRAVDEVAYTGAAILSGSSLQLIDPTSDNGNLVNWCLATVPWGSSMGDKGTPGEPTVCATGVDAGSDAPAPDSAPSDAILPWCDADPATIPDMGCQY